MHLGTLMTRLEREEDAGEALAALGDIVLYAEVLAASERHGESPAAYTAGAVVRFAGAAGDEDWVGLVGALERARNPAREMLSRALRWALARDAEESAATPLGGPAAGLRLRPSHDPLR